jgi:hypothetical protein
MAGQTSHACLVPEDGTTRHTRGRIHGEYRHAVASADDVQSEGFDERGLSDPGRPGNPDAQRAASDPRPGCGLGRCDPVGVSERSQHRLGVLAVVDPGRLGEGDGTGQRPSVPGLHTVGEFGGLL